MFWFKNMFLIPCFGLKLRKGTAPFLSQSKVTSMTHHSL